MAARSEEDGEAVSSRKGSYRFALRIPGIASEGSAAETHARLAVGSAHGGVLSLEEGRLLMHNTMLETSLDPTMQSRWQLAATLEATLGGGAVKFDAAGARFESKRGAWVVSGAPLAGGWLYRIGK